MKHTQRKWVGLVLAIVGWIFSVGGVAITALVVLPVLFVGANLVTFLMVLLFMLGLVAMGPALVHWGDQLRLPVFGMCPQCDYDLRGQRGDGCPECGWRRGRDAR